MIRFLAAGSGKRYRCVARFGTTPQECPRERSDDDRHRLDAVVLVRDHDVESRDIGARGIPGNRAALLDQ
jgi:hypothetical protein